MTNDIILLPKDLYAIIILIGRIKMDREYLKQLFVNMQEIMKVDSLDEKLALLKENNKMIVDELSINLNDTIDFLNTCSAKELFWSCAFIIELSEYFRTKELVKCIESNMARVAEKGLRESIKLELDFIKNYV